MKNHISQLNGIEQNAIFCIKKLVGNQLNALLIYCFGCKTNSEVTRTAFQKKQYKEERKFTCDLLIITPNNIIVDEKRKLEIQEIVSHFGTVNLVIHSLDFVIRSMNDDNIFFNWVHKNGMLLLDYNNSSQLLSSPVPNEYRSQAEAFYNNNQLTNSYLTAKFENNKKDEEV